MKKIILALSVVALAVSCKKLPEGGNKGVLKREADVERYTDDIQGGGHSSHAGHSDAHSGELVDVEIAGLHLKAKKNGLEEQLAQFLGGDTFKNADENTLKNKWFDFDNVNFKMGSATQLEVGAEQIKNLAEILKKYPEAKIKIGGYTDKTGDEAVNKKISQDRANFIKAELAKLGVAGQVISAEGYGSEFAQVASETSDEERAKDRKMSIRFVK